MQYSKKHYFLFFIIKVLSYIPFWALYVISDIMYYPLYYIIRYRRKIVRKNLTESFPEKNHHEIISIEKKFYHFFMDMVLESGKLATISPDEIMKRMKFSNIKMTNDLLDQGKSVDYFMGHYCNWEWVTSLPLWAGDDITFGQIYHVLENPAFDKLFLYLRNRLGAISIPMAETLRKIVKMRQEGKQIAIGFIADQVPFWNNIHYWTDFLHHDTPVLTGTEKIAVKANFAVYYLDMQRVKRGYYKGEFKLLTDKPKECREFEITEMYFRALEKSIQRQPAYWLWTHNRWKRTREQWLKIVDPVTHKMRRDLQ